MEQSKKNPIDSIADAMRDATEGCGPDEGFFLVVASHDKKTMALVTRQDGAWPDELARVEIASGLVANVGIEDVTVRTIILSEEKIADAVQKFPPNTTTGGTPKARG